MFSDIKNEPYISVIIPCYNAEKTIEKTLNSLEKQSFVDFEVVIINDGSKDSSDSIIKKYIENSNLEINYIIQENAGVSSARNVGLAMARGKLITFLDSDDIYHRDYIKILSQSLDRNNTDTAYCCYSRNVGDLYNDANDKYVYDSIVFYHNELMSNFMHRKGPCGFFNFIYKKSIIVDHGIKFTLNTKYGEDLEFTWKYLSHCEKGVFVDIELYGYYDNPDSAMNNVKWSMVEVLSSIKRVEEYLKYRKDSFYPEFCSYMYDRTVWAVLKDFSRSSQKDLYYKLAKDIDAKKSMQNISKNSTDIRIKISALMFCINEDIFYYLCKMFYKYNSK